MLLVSTNAAERAVNNLEGTCSGARKKYMAVRTDDVEDLDIIVEEERQLHIDLKKLEKQIYGLETSYLESTASAGNLVRGWGDTLSRPPSGAGRKKRRKVSQEDRIFSLSSATAMKVGQAVLL